MSQNKRKTVFEAAQPKPVLRYSPRPVEEYNAGHIGPATDARVDRPEVWNLAYLSHPFERLPLHQDPAFLTHVRRTAQVEVATGLIDMTFAKYGSNDLLASRLLMPAPWFVKWLMQDKRLLVGLPLYKAYGQAWLQTIERRARICHTYEEEPDEPIGDVSQARGLLLKFRRR